MAARREIGNLARFELYSIEIKKITPDRRDLVRKIFMDSGSGIEVLYNLEDDKEEFPIGEPLSLTGPARPCSPYNPVYICFGEWNLGWRFRIKWDDEEDQYINRPVIVEVQDADTDSVATVLYEIISKSVEACFRLRFEDKENRVIRITNGEIVASRDEVQDTRRVLRSFDDVEVKAGEEIQLDKSILALHVQVNLCVSVNLEYELLPPLKKSTQEKQKPIEMEMYRGTVNKTLSLPVPEKRKIDPLVFSDDEFPGPELIAEVNWVDDLYKVKKFPGLNMDSIKKLALQLDEEAKLAKKKGSD